MLRIFLLLLNRYEILPVTCALTHFRRMRRRCLIWESTAVKTEPVLMRSVFWLADFVVAVWNSTIVLYFRYCVLSRTYTGNRVVFVLLHLQMVSSCPRHVQIKGYYMLDTLSNKLFSTRPVLTSPADNEGEIGKIKMGTNISLYTLCVFYFHLVIS